MSMIGVFVGTTLGTTFVLVGDGNGESSISPMSSEL